MDDRIRDRRTEYVTREDNGWLVKLNPAGGTGRSTGLRRRRCARLGSCCAARRT